MSKWISVGERLPENDEYVLTYSRKWPSQCIKIFWYSTASEMWMTNMGFGASDITHWQPLPPPPSPGADS